MLLPRLDGLPLPWHPRPTTPPPQPHPPLVTLQGLNERCARELGVIGEQYPFEPLMFLEKSLRLTFAEGIQLLQEAGYDVSAALVCFRFGVRRASRCKKRRAAM